MNSGREDWDPTSPEAWGKLLGLVPVPLFAPGTPRIPAGSHHVLLDGQRASFAMSTADERDLGDAPLSWSWSSNLRHLLVVDQRLGDMVLRRWDAPSDSRRIPLPRAGEDAKRLLEEMETAAAPRAEHVVNRLLGIFRQLREALPDDAADAIRVLNVLLVGAERVHDGALSKREWLRCRRVGDAIQVLEKHERDESGASEISARVKQSSIGAFPPLFLAQQPITGCRLDPGLLLRHAASQLYQEAHIHIEREPQLNLPGFESDRAPSGAPTKKDVRFTPPTLARALAQQALDSYFEAHHSSNEIRILDPACGSGIFLQEALRELCRRNYRGAVRVVGYDTSPISRTIATFCLARAARDAKKYGIDAHISVDERDALSGSWERTDIVLMNPPFVSWQTMSEDDRNTARKVLAELGSGRLDTAMAFLWKAVQSLPPSGTLASVLPASLLETKSGTKLREKLAEGASVRLIGRFEGIRYFRGVKAESAFIVLQKKHDARPTQSTTIQFLRADKNAEDAALRALRRDDAHSGTGGHNAWGISRVSSVALSPFSWSPPARGSEAIIEQLTRVGLPQVKDLFDVKQGARSGAKSVFVLRAADVAGLPEKERSYFREVADEVHDGKLVQSKHIFYPYDENGLTLKTEADLKTLVSTYYKNWLMPAREMLADRQRVGSQWWVLAEPRSWQRRSAPKLVSTYFGDMGSFAYDNEGRFIVLQGMAWVWKKQTSVGSVALPFHGSEFPWAYLALLNSSVFESMLSFCCPQIDGKQYDLSPRYVYKCFLPDLTNGAWIGSSMVPELARLGRLLHEGKVRAIEREQLSRAARLAYGLEQSPVLSIGGDVAISDAIHAAIQYVRLQLGTTPWTDIAKLVLTSLCSDIHELTLPRIADLADEHGFRREDILLVVEKMARSEDAYLERSFLRGKGLKQAVVSEEEVKKRLRAAMTSSADGEKGWKIWSSETRVVWHLSTHMKEPRS